MKVFTREEIRALAERRDPEQVSLHMPTNPVGDRSMQDPIRLKNLLTRARGELVAAGMRGPDADRLLQPATDLVEDAMFWKQGGAGLVVFLARDFSRIYRVPLPLPEAVVVGNEFHLKPLLPLLQEDGTWFVLVVGAHHNRLLQCTRHSVARVLVPGAPENLDEATRWTEEPGPNLHQHSGTQRGGRTKGSGWGHPTTFPQNFGEEDRRKNDFMEYFQRLDAALREVLAGERGPLVFAGMERRFPMYLEANTYPWIVHQALQGNLEHESDEALRDRSWPLVEPIFRERRVRDEHRLLNLSGTGLQGTQLPEVLEAAVFGRLDTLFVSRDSTVFGTFDRDSAACDVHDQEQPGDKDLLNEAAILGLLRGANVYVVPREELPIDDGAGVNAIYRW